MEIIEQWLWRDAVLQWRGLTRRQELFRRYAGQWNAARHGRERHQRMEGDQWRRWWLCRFRFQYTSDALCRDARTFVREEHRWRRDVWRCDRRLERRFVVCRAFSNRLKRSPAVVDRRQSYLAHDQWRCAMERRQFGNRRRVASERDRHRPNRFEPRACRNGRWLHSSAGER